MLIFNPRRALSLRGIANPHKFLAANGFINTTASNLLNGKSSFIKPEHLEKMCILLNCTPNDLFDWKPDKKNAVAENHPLNTMIRAETAHDIAEMVKELPLDQFDKVAALLKELKTG